MKYLNSRDNYLKSINERRIVENNNKIDTSINKLILENQAGSGAMGNEIKWGDSLLGRLINHIIRKVGVGVSIVRMQPLIARLKSEFDNIAVEATVNELDATQKEQFALIGIFSILNKLENTILNLHIKKTPLSEIKALTESAIDFVEKTEDIPDKNQLLQKLKVWKEFIDGLKLEEFEEKETLDDKQSKNLYEYSIQNLRSVLNIVKIYDEMMKKKFYIVAPVLSAPLKSDEVKPDQTVTAPTKKPTVEEKEQELLTKWKEEQKKQGKNINPGEGTRERIKKEAEKAVIESLLFEDNNQVGGVKQNPDGTVQWNFKNSSNINSVVKQLYSYFKSDPDVINELDAFLKMTPEQRAESGKKRKAPIEKIYTLVRKKFGVNEGLESFLTKPELIVDKINKLYEVTVKNDVMNASDEEVKKNFENSENLVLWEKMKQELVNFNTTMRAVLNPELHFGKTNVEVKSDEKTEERFITKYDKFFSKLNEADEVDKPESPIESEGDKGTPKELMVKGIVVKIQDYWSKKMDLKAWVLDETEVDKIKENLEIQLATKKDSYKISGIDPIINILKLFNRAYKLHTTEVIPGGRSDGAIDRATYNEYTAFGSGSTPNAISNGPYRNKKTFNLWEDAVLDIMADRKYQPIFNPETEVIVGDKVKKGAGVALRKMMTDLLDGDNLYKGDSKDSGSTQKKMLDRYFGELSDDQFKGLTAKELSMSDLNPETGKPDADGNATIANKIKDLEYVFDTTESLKESSVIKDRKYKGSFLQIKGKNDKNEDSTLYCFVQEAEQGFVYLVYSRSFYYFKKYIEDQGGGSPTFKKGESGANLRLGKDDKLLYGTVVKFEELEKVLNGKAAKIQLNSISSDIKNPIFEEKEDFIPADAYWLASVSKEEDKETKSVYALSDFGKLRSSINVIGGFTKILELKTKTYKDGKFTAITKI